MPEISRFFGIIIKMFFNDHAPPHFHVEYGGYKAIIDIETKEITEGYLPPKQLKLVQAWAIIHEEELTYNFNGLQSEEHIWKTIEPLQKCMLYFIKQIKEVKPYLVVCLFNNNETRVIDFADTIDKYKNQPLNILHKLKEVDYFNSVQLDSYGTLCWHNEIDFCPDVLYANSKHLNE